MPNHDLITQDKVNVNPKFIYISFLNAKATYRPLPIQFTITRNSRSRKVLTHRQGAACPNPPKINLNRNISSNL